MKYSQIKYLLELIKNFYINYDSKNDIIFDLRKYSGISEKEFSDEFLYKILDYIF